MKEESLSKSAKLEDNYKTRKNSTDKFEAEPGTCLLEIVPFSMLDEWVKIKYPEIKID